MKKWLVTILIAIVLLVPIAGATADIAIEKSEVKHQSVISNYDSSHMVLVELGSTPSCPYCVKASEQLSNIYDTDQLAFNYVTLVYTEEMSYRALERLQDLGITGVPDVFFDSKYKHLSGAQDDEQPYINAITQAGTREVADIDIDVNVGWLGGGKLKIDITVTNNEPEEFNGLLRTYIVEHVSRWKDQRGNPFRFGVLDIPIDQSPALVKNQPGILGGTYTFSRTWYGSIWGFGDITQENTMVIAAVFESGNDHAVQTAAGEPTSSSKTCNIPNMLIRILEHFPMLRLLLGFN